MARKNRRCVSTARVETSHWLPSVCKRRDRDISLQTTHLRENEPENEVLAGVRRFSQEYLSNELMHHHDLSF